MSGGGSGDRYLPSNELRRLQVDAIRDLTTEEDTAEINGFLRQELAAFNERNKDPVANHLDDIRSNLAEMVESEINLLYGGSVAKHTYVDGLSDVDALLVLRSNAVPTAESPADLMAILAAAISAANLDVVSMETSGLAVNVVFGDGSRLDVLPAIRRPGGLSIASEDGASWVTIRPEQFARKLTAVNQAVGGQVVPVIKLAKAILSDVPEGRRLSGYHVESLAIEAFESYQGPRTLRDMVRHFFAEASVRVLRPIQDSTGQSIHVDDELGAARSEQRRLRADTLGRLSRRLESATTADQWRELFRGVDE